jgi:hypothetical protein
MEVASEHKEQLKVCCIPFLLAHVWMAADDMVDRDERRKRINSSRADCRRSNFLRCRRRLLEMRRRDMDSGVLHSLVR